jgi:segregation and condensation protein A
MYQVKLEKFEGPMELLLELIEKEKMEITELSMAKVTDQYLEYIRDNQNIHLENLVDFLSVAARLILIKSRSLLPMLKFSEEEEAEIKDLTYQLEEYKKFKKASEVLGKMAEAGKIAYSREGFGGIKSIFYPPEDLNAYDLKKYFMAVLAEIPIVEKLEEEIVDEVVTLEERINDLQNALRSKVESSFSSLVEKATDKVDVIISFLAMLEMIKQRVVEVRQDDLFSEIKLSIKNSV